jgi:hypothetical protein
VQSAVLKAGFLKMKDSSKRGVIAATEALSYDQTRFLIQENFNKRDNL